MKDGILELRAELGGKTMVVREDGSHWLEDKNGNIILAEYGET